jgi:putative transcriptional regulator
MEIETLEPPLFLIAMPQVADPYFNRSVVLLLEHNDEGSFGIIINRPLDMTVSAVLGDLGMKWRGDEELQVYLGGPVQPTAGLTIFGEDELLADPERVRKIAPGLHLANDSETLTAIATAPPAQVRLLVGYAGWGEGQLEQELSRNDWLLAPIRAELIFSDEPHSVWERALESIGVRPESLPSWTVPDDDQKGN